MRSFTTPHLVMLLAGLGISCGAARANDIYLAQNAAGAADGQSCATARAVGFFNAASNWGGGANQIGPGTTVHLCGTISDNVAGDSLLIFQGSGTSGNPITLKFEPNATLTNTAYWGMNGAINITSRNWIVVDGGGSGIVQNLGNGSAGVYPYSQPSDGLVVQSSSNITVQGLIIANICAHSASQSDSIGCNKGGVNDQALTLNTVSNVLIAGNTVHDAQNCIYYNMAAGDANVVISNNIVSHCNWGIGVGQTGASSGLTITGNDISDAFLWDDQQDSFHHNGVIVYGTTSATSLSGLVIASNYIHGDMGVNETGDIFLDPTGGPLGNMPGVLIYNNVLANGSTTHGPANGYITVGHGITGAGIFNNTIYGNGYGADGIDAVGATLANNIVSSVYTGIQVDRGETIASSDYNDAYNLTGGALSMSFNGTNYPTLSAWSTALGFDQHSLTGNPDLTATYTLAAGSAAIGTGVNLSALGIAGLMADKAGNPRPAMGAWDIGAYESVTQVTTGQRPLPPSLLTVTVR